MSIVLYGQSPHSTKLPPPQRFIFIDLNFIVIITLHQME